VTDPAAAGQPPAHFHRNLRAVVSCLFFRVARALKNSQLTDGERHVIYGTDTKIKACVIGPLEPPSAVISIFLNW
jgi:hypothetical protein